MKRRLIYKLLAINLAVLGFVMVVVWMAIDTLAAGYFVTLMEKYHISPEPAHAMFVEAVHRYLLWAALAAVALAVLLSYLLMRRVLSPLVRMTAISQDIAAGDFQARAPALSQDEVGQLAQAFNHMAASLEKLEDLRRRLMIDVAHELRTPLTNIRGYLEALSDGLLPPSPQVFAMLQEETMRLAGLVEDVLQLAKADAARGHLQREPLDLAELMDTALQNLEPAFSQRSIQVRLNPGQGPLLVQADRQGLSRVLRNLLDNAARYAPAHSQVEISLSAAAGQVRAELSNQAGELVAEDLPYLFERFYRGEKSRSRRHGGAGIGLSLVKELVEAHHGAVGAELDQGRLRIWFTLPAGPPLEKKTV